jgi:hypothetical protein
MIQRWGHGRVSSAFEVYLVLTRPPSDARGFWLWKNQLSIEPPIWGCAAARGFALSLAARGVRVWSWDDDGVVFSDFDGLPFPTLRYRPWHRLELPAATSPREPSRPSLTTTAKSTRGPSPP